MIYDGLFLSMRDYTRHSWDVPYHGSAAKYFKTAMAATVTGALGLLFSKLAILLLLFRLFSPNRLTRYLIFFGMSCAVAIMITGIIAAGAFCAPRHEESFGSWSVISRCKHQEVWGVTQGALNVALDLLILCLPVPTIWNLKMSLKKKVGVLSIFMTGLW